MAFGIFNDEGMIVGDFETAEEARTWMVRDGDADCFVDEVCSEHPEEPAVGCQSCPADDADDADECPECGAIHAHQHGAD